MAKTTKYQTNNYEEFLDKIVEISNKDMNIIYTSEKSSEVRSSYIEASVRSETMYEGIPKEYTKIETIYTLIYN